MYIENITENKTTPKQKQNNENVMYIRQNNENVMYIENIMIFDPINSLTSLHISIKSIYRIFDSTNP